MAFLIPHYAPDGVVVSLLIATYASYVTLDLAKRVRAPDRTVARVWWMGGSVAMGTGIWAMHFVGMFAFSLPIELGYRGLQTLVSWVAAVLVSAVALGIASRGRLTPKRLALGAVTMGAGICAMHYIGMAALEMAPGIVWNWPLVAASAAIAVGASTAALLIFFWLRRFGTERGRMYQLAAAVVMGLAIGGMHYTGMAAAQFPLGSLCLSTNGLASNQLGVLVVVATVLLLSVTLFTSMLDARLHSKALILAESLSASNIKLQEANEELRRTALQDPLTGLANRLLFEDRLRHAQARNDAAAGRAPPLAVMLVNLDGFKPVNDSLGHAIGDRLLKEVAQRLLEVTRESDTVARVGSDEFVLLVEAGGAHGSTSGLAQRVVRSLAQPYQLAGLSLGLHASVGVAIYPEHGPADKLQSHADAAMQAAKRQGGNGYALFESHMDAGALEQLSLQTDLRQALEAGQFLLHYQPKFDARRGRIRSVEALLRWQHPQRGMVSPVEFIPLAERYGLINAIGAWVIDEACRQMQAWQREGLRLQVAVNLSVHQLRQEGLAQHIAAALRRHDVQPSRLLCEITESVAMEDMEAMQRVFNELSEIGVYLSIDDFGTGYSSLSYLRRLPAQQLKIDRSFVKDLDTSGDARAVVDAVIKLAHALGLSVVAEGVETEAQRDILQTFECDELQGYLFARPMPPGSLLDWARGLKPSGGADFSASVFMTDSSGGIRASLAEPPDSYPL